LVCGPKRTGRSRATSLRRCARRCVSERVLITGAAGQIGTHLRRTLVRPNRTLRLLDLVVMTPDDDEAAES